MIYLIIALALLFAMLVGYFVVQGKKAIKKMPKKNKQKPVPPKKESGELKIGGERPVVVPEVLPETNDEEPEEIISENLEEQDSQKPSKEEYVPSWDQEKYDEDEEEDDLDEYLHFPGLSKAVMHGKTLGEQIRNLPDEIKAIMLSNVLDKKE